MGKSKSRSGGKGKKKGKRDNLSEEEKKKLAEQKALAEKEKLIARQNLTKAFLKVKKDKEYELVKLNNNKILDLWRPHLRKQKIKELLEEYQYIRAAFEKAYDKKSQWIADLEKNLGKNEGDYEQATNGHLSMIDKLMEFYDQRLKEVEQFYEDARSELYACLEFERKKIQKAHTLKMEELRSGMVKLAEDVARADEAARLEQYTKLMEIRTQGNHELYLYRNLMTEKANEVWSQLHYKVMGYVNTNGDKKKELVELLAKDEIMSKTVQDLYERRAVLVDGIKEIRKQRELFAQAYDLYITNIKDIRDKNRDIYNKVSTNRKKLLKKSQSALLELSLAVFGVNEELDGLVDKREKVLLLVSRVLEDENEIEGVDPFLGHLGLGGINQLEDWSNKVTTDQNLESGKNKGLNKFFIEVNNVVHRFDCDCVKCTCESDGEPDQIHGPIKSMIQSYAKLDRFWIRYNKVSLEHLAIAQERQKVLKDNKDLKLCIKHYMAGLNPPALDTFKYSPKIFEENTRKIEEFMENMVQAKLRRKCGELGVKRIK